MHRISVLLSPSSFVEFGCLLGHANVIFSELTFACPLRCCSQLAFLASKLKLLLFFMHDE